MKKFLLMCFLYCFALFPAFGYTQDTELQKCMKDGEYTTYAMTKCTYERGDFYKNLSKTQTEKLKNELSPTEYKKLIQNQKLLELYIKSLKSGAIDILSSTTGSMYPTIASGIYYDTYYDNTKILNMLLTKQVCKEELLNQIPLSNMEKSINQKLAVLKNNLKPTEDKAAYNYQKAYIYDMEYNRYWDVKRSQEAWIKYYNDTEKNIIPMFKTESNIQSYIKRLLYESRISVLDTINTPFEEN